MRFVIFFLNQIIEILRINRNHLELFRMIYINLVKKNLIKQFSNKSSGKILQYSSLHVNKLRSIAMTFTRSLQALSQAKCVTMTNIRLSIIISKALVEFSIPFH